ncbi:MAG: hypothetical protein AAF235_06390 [Planctomycetota bacterium]
MDREAEEHVSVSAFGRHLYDSAADPFWPADVQALLTDEHLAAWSVTPRAASDFAASLRQFLSLQPDTEVWTISCGTVHSLADAAAALEQFVPYGPIRPNIDGPGGITDALRQRGPSVFGSVARFRYIIWLDCDAAIEAAPKVFSKIVDAALGVAAEAEYATDELLAIHRSVFLGSDKLRAYASDARSQFRRWLGDAGQRPFWECVTGLEAPPVAVRRVERLVQGGVL